MQAHPTGADPDSVLLALTELVSNAARHGSGPIEVELSGHSGRLLLRVSDGSSALPRQQGPADQAAESGRGIVLVDAVTSQWGVLLQPHGGKTVWCEFRPAPIG